MRNPAFTLLLALGLSLELIAQPTNNPVETALKPLGINDPFEPEKLVAVPEEIEIVSNKYRQEALPLLEAASFDKLEEMATALRASKKQISSGYWELDCFYRTLSRCEKKDAPEVWEKRRSQLEAWAKKKPDSPTPQACLADFWCSYAWQARGTGFSNTVTEKGWELMGERMGKAAKILSLNQKFESACPRFYAMSQRVALAVGWPRAQFDHLYKTANSAHPGYMFYTYNRIQYLQPRWHGENEQEWLEFATKEADRLGGEEGDLFYARAACFMFDLHYYEGFLRDSGVEWLRLRQGLEVCIKRFPDSLWAKSRLCYFSAQKVEKQRAKQLFLEIGYQVDEEVWSKERFLLYREFAFRRVFHPQPKAAPTSSPP